MPVQKLKSFLDDQKIKYVVVRHSRAYTAQEIAASAHIPGQEMAKTVVVMVDGRMALAVLPASTQIDFMALREATGAKQVTLADEIDFAERFGECELGAMPPFGNLYGMDVYVAESLTQDEEIAFNAGTHQELIKLAYRDFERLVRPKVLAFSAC